METKCSASLGPVLTVVHHLGRPRQLPDFLHAEHARAARTSPRGAAVSYVLPHPQSTSRTGCLPSPLPRVDRMVLTAAPGA